MMTLRLLIIVLSVMLLSVSMCIANQPIQLVKPTQKQLAFADWEVGAFLCLALCQYIELDFGDGQFSPSLFNPMDADVDQWIRTAKSMGAKYAVFTAKHSGGFCLWPTQACDYNISKSPYKGGKGDLVREFVEACRRHGMKVGLYHASANDAYATLGGDYANWGRYELPLRWNSTWGKAMAEAHQRDPGLKERFKQIQVERVRELLTWYGPIDFMWTDHWDATDPDGAYRATTLLAEELQPEMVLMGPDTWIPGNETGHVLYPMWNCVNTKDGTRFSRPTDKGNEISIPNHYGLLETHAVQGDPLGKYWRVRECTTNSAFHYGGWFWQPDRVRKTYPKKTWEHLDLYYRTVGLGANTIINIPINDRGIIPYDFVKATKAFGNEITKRFANPIAQTFRIETGDIVELTWPEETEINTVVTMENIKNGQKISKYTLEAWVDGQWQALEPRNRLIAQKPYNNNPGYETIGHKKIDRVKPVVTNRVRFRAIEAAAHPVEIRSLAVFNCNPIIRTFNAEYPYLSGVDTLFDEAHGGMKRDINYDGKPLTLNGKNYQRGLLLCPVGMTGIGVAEFDMALAPNAKGMTADIGIEDMIGSNGSCEFIIEGLVGNNWKELYKSAILRGGDKTVRIDVEFPKGMQQLRLKTTMVDNGACDHALWADAKFRE